MARYREYEDLPEHLKGMLRAVTSDDGAAERFFHAPNKLLRGTTPKKVVNSWFGQRALERFLVELGNFLGVDDMERFESEFGKRR